MSECGFETATWLITIYCFDDHLIYSTLLSSPSKLLSSRCALMLKARIHHPSSGHVKMSISSQPIAALFESQWANYFYPTCISCTSSDMIIVGIINTSRTNLDTFVEWHVRFHTILTSEITAEAFQ